MFLINLLFLAYFACMVVASAEEIRKEGHYTMAVFTAITTIATLWKIS